MKKNAIRGLLEMDVLEKASVIGVGTGSTVALLIEEMPREILAEKLFATTSIDTMLRLKRRGARIVDISSVDEIDVYVDSADFFDINLNLIKGGGAAHFREKVLALQSRRFIAVVDESKFRENLLSEPIPLEVHPLALGYVLKRIKLLGLDASVRESGQGKWGPVVSESGGVVLDVNARKWRKSLKELDRELKMITGVIETGLFIEMVESIIVGGIEGYRVLTRR